MPPSGSIYERELKAILEKAGFMVVRAAGSLGVDLVALKDGIAFPIEVKSSRHQTIHFSSGGGKNQLQAEQYLAECRRTGQIPLYAFRWKTRTKVDDRWRVSCLGDNPSRTMFLYFDKTGELQSVTLPNVAHTNKGAYALRWEAGMPLQEFLQRLRYD